MKMPVGRPRKGLVDQRWADSSKPAGTSAGNSSVFGPERVGAPARVEPRRAQRRSTQRLRLEFAPNARRVSRLGVLMLIVSGAMLAAGAVQLAIALTDNAQMAGTLAAVDARRGTAGAIATRTNAPDPAEAARMRAVRQVAQNLMTPWADLLDSLESTTIQKVAILSIEPSVAKHSIRLTAEASSAQDMLAYLGALQREPRLSSVMLVSHQVQAQASGTPVRFQVQATWGAGQ